MEEILARELKKPMHACSLKLGSGEGAPLVFVIYQNPKHQKPKKILNTEATIALLLGIWSPYNPIVIVSHA